jgi:hypothetical protein
LQRLAYTRLVQHIAGPINGLYFAAFTVQAGHKVFGYAKLTADRPAHVWDGTPSLRWLQMGPFDLESMAMAIVIDHAKTACTEKDIDRSRLRLPDDPASRQRILRLLLALMKLPPDKRRILINASLERRGLGWMSKPVPPPTSPT